MEGIQNELEFFHKKKKKRYKVQKLFSKTICWMFVIILVIQHSYSKGSEPLRTMNAVSHFAKVIFLGFHGTNILSNFGMHVMGSSLLFKQRLQGQRQFPISEENFFFSAVCFCFSSICLFSLGTMIKLKNWTFIVLETASNSWGAMLSSALNNHQRITKCHNYKLI